MASFQIVPASEHAYVLGRVLFLMIQAAHDGVSRF